MNIVPETKGRPRGEIGAADLGNGLRALSRAVDLGLHREYAGVIEVDLTHAAEASAVDVATRIAKGMTGVSVHEFYGPDGAESRTIAGRLMLMPVEVVTVAAHTDDLARTLRSKR